MSDLNREIESYATYIADILKRASRDETSESWYEDVQDAIGEIVSDVHDRREEARRKKVPKDAVPVNAAEIAARSAKRLRLASGWTQADLADLMTNLGFDWKQQTVADGEVLNVGSGGPKRRLSIEEMLALALLYETPVAGIMTGLDPGEILVLNDRLTLNAYQAQSAMTARLLEAQHGFEHGLGGVARQVLFGGEKPTYARPVDNISHDFWRGP